MKVLAHRGVVGPGAVENTMEAFAAAVALGVDGIETDVRTDADGRLVLAHDRCRDGRPVVTMSAAEVEAAFAPAHVPTVAEALDAWPDLWWNLELKDARAGPALLALLTARPARGERSTRRISP